MPARFPSISRLLIVPVFALSVAARAELIKVSPFLPPQGSTSAATPNAPLEYRGSMEIGQVQQFRVVDPQRKVGSWLKLGERDPNLDVVVKQHERDPDTLVVEHNGQSLTLQLHVAKVTAGANFGMVMAGQPMPAQIQNVSPAVINTVVPNPTPADEQRRLEAVAAEVARRRALREQAAQQAAQQGGGPAQPNVTRQELQQMQPPQYPVRRRR
ncbi:MAG TPA: hypothetical protein VHE61_06620 [Opitutaceae bacterium]|nr:hypothetical protein [Opitutaceae bacterium]